MRWIIALIALTSGAAAQEQGLPEPGFFEGSYELVGRGPGGALWEEPIRLTAAGTVLEAASCARGTGALRWERVHESMRLTGMLGDLALSCNFAVDGGNYPILICVGPEGVRLTGWPEADFGAALDCH